MKTAAALLSLAAGLAAAPALAQGAPEQAPGRYQFQPVEGGLAKLDTATGEITVCRLDPVSLACDPVAPAPAAGTGARPAAPPSPPVAEREDEEFDKALDRMKRVFRAFGDVAREFDSPGPAVPGTEPNRT